MPQPVYLDHAATTPVRPEVLEAMLPYLGEEAFGNPSSAHRFGRTARAGVEQARRQIADAIPGVDPSQVIFTAGGTEADNLAVLGGALASRQRGLPMTAVVAATEHKAVLGAAHAVAGLGGTELVLPVTRQGIVQMDALTDALKHSPSVVSVMWVNNETGVVQPIATIAERCAEAGVAFHSDAAQAFGKVPVAVDDTIPLLTITGHKIGAPKGIGALIARRDALVAPLIHGGGQQRGIRPGTENVAGIVGLGRAAELAARDQAGEAARLQTLRDALMHHLQEAVPDVTVVAAGAERAPHILNVMIPGTDSEAMLMHLDLAGVAASSGSACSTGSVEPSHVHTALGIPPDQAVTVIRFSLGHESSSDDIVRAAEVVPACVAKVRKLAGALGGGRG